MQKKIALLCVAAALTATHVVSQTDTTQNADLETRLKTRCEERKQTDKQDETFRRFFIGSSGMMVGNFATDEQVQFYQLNFGYRITPKDVISLEAITWRYAWSLGIPYGSSFDAPEEKFPGSIKEYGIGVAYQRFLWKGLYAGIHALNAHQSFRDEDDKQIKTGYQLFMSYRVGYHVSFFKNRFFIEPSVCITHRAFHTKMPESFAVLDNKWSKFFFGEPGLHFGVNF
ncbi:MAG: hypothetical protein FWC39_05525 [Bacteroidetes bacterium]|nr:hypothetical protein [Bacteroidota bacterium]